MVFTAVLEGEGKVSIHLFVPKGYVPEKVHDDRNIQIVRYFRDFLSKFGDIFRSWNPPFPKLHGRLYTDGIQKTYSVSPAR
jgi:hypothetical protein